MTRTLLAFTLFAIGAVAVAYGPVALLRDTFDKAETAVNSANERQLATVLELYHLDHGNYPLVRGGEALFDLLYQKQYLLARPPRVDAIAYEPRHGGQSYALGIVE